MIRMSWVSKLGDQWVREALPRLRGVRESNYVPVRRSFSCGQSSLAFRGRQWVGVYVGRSELPLLWHISRESAEAQMDDLETNIPLFGGQHSKSESFALNTTAWG